MTQKITPGEIITGKVKAVKPFGAFVDLGGVDGLLHIEDMSWGHVRHPGDVASAGDEVRVKVLSVDEKAGRYALGLKQLEPNPWTGAEEKYPVGSHVKGKVVSVTEYGAFVLVGMAVKGLLHKNDMSWTRFINHGSEMVRTGDVLELVVLNIDVANEKLRLGLKQLKENPLEVFRREHPLGTRVRGRIREVKPYGAFVDVTEEIRGLLHLSNMSWFRKSGERLRNTLEEGATIECAVLDVSLEEKKVSLGLKQLVADPWLEEIPDKYHVGDIARVRVTNTVRYGAFVEFEGGLESLIHVSEMGDESLSEGDTVDVKIISVDAEENISNYFKFYNTERIHQSLDYRTPEEVYLGKSYPNQMLIEGIKNHLKGTEILSKGWG